MVFCRVMDALPEQCLAEEVLRTSFSLRFLELSDDYGSAVRRHVYAADALVSLSVDRNDFR